MSHIIDLALMALDVYEDGFNSELLGRWKVQDRLNIDNLRIRAYRNDKTGTLVLAVRGTDNWKDAVYSDLMGIGLGGGVLGLKLNDAVTFSSDTALGVKDVWLTGHSLGGAYVQLLAAILELPGVTFNAPGAVAMLNQMDRSIFTAITGGLGSGAMQILASLKGLGDVVNFITKAGAGGSNNAFAAVANYRGNMDPVSKVGVHVGTPVKTIQLASQQPHPHHMKPLIEALKAQANR